MAFELDIGSNPNPAPAQPAIQAPAPQAEPVAEPVEPSIDAQPQEPVLEEVPQPEYEQQFDESGQPIEQAPPEPVQAATPEPDPELVRRAETADRYMKDPVARFYLAQRERELASEAGDIEPGWVTSTLANPPAAIQQRMQPQQQQNQQPQYTPQQMHNGFRNAIDQAMQKIEGLIDAGKYADAERVRRTELKPVEYQYKDWEAAQTAQQLNGVHQRFEQERQAAKESADKAAQLQRLQGVRQEIHSTITTYPKELHIVNGKNGRELRAIDPAVDKHFQKFQNLPSREALEYALQLVGRFKPAPAVRTTQAQNVPQRQSIGSAPRTPQAQPRQGGFNLDVGPSPNELAQARARQRQA